MNRKKKPPKKDKREKDKNGERKRESKKKRKKERKKERKGKKNEKKKLVIQVSHMVSGTRCPAWSDQLKQWSGSRAVAPKGRCPGMENKGCSFYSTLA